MSLKQHLKFEVYEPTLHHNLAKSLFELSFQKTLPDTLWHWKTQTMRGVGLCAFLDGRMVAFFGGMPREFIYQDRSFMFLQLCDVMVHPKTRGILSRKGAFTLTGNTFLDIFMHPQGEFLSGFGFPNERALRIGEISGLYKAIDIIWEYAWTANPKTDLFYKTKQIQKENQRLQQRYQKSVDAFVKSTWDYVVGEKSWGFINKRYLEHPTFEYQLIECCSWPYPSVYALAKPLNSTRLEIVDLIGTIKGFSCAIDNLRGWAYARGYKTVSGWFSESLTPWLLPCNQIQQVCRVPKPKQHGMPWTESMNGKMLLMAGDTDFK